MARLLSGVILALALGCATAFTPLRTTPAATRTVALQATPKENAGTAAAVALLALGLANPAFAITSEERAQLSYLQVKGTGLANRC